jgi:hypothetical protein
VTPQRLRAPLVHAVRAARPLHEGLEACPQRLTGASGQGPRARVRRTCPAIAQSLVRADGSARRADLLWLPSGEPESFGQDELPCPSLPGRPPAASAMEPERLVQRRCRG